MLNCVDCYMRVYSHKSYACEMSLAAFQRVSIDSFVPMYDCVRVNVECVPHVNQIHWNVFFARMFCGRNKTSKQFRIFLT